MGKTEKITKGEQLIEIKLSDTQDGITIQKTKRIVLEPGLIIDYHYVYGQLNYRIENQKLINSKFNLNDKVRAWSIEAENFVVGEVIMKGSDRSKIKYGEKDDSYFYAMNSEITKI